jgi:uncharacterized protein YukE
MHGGQFQACSGQLQDAVDRLRIRWEEVREVWRDDVARRFEEQEMQLILRAFEGVPPAVSQIAQAVMSAERALQDVDR